MHFDDCPEGEIDDNQVTVLRAIADHQRFTYEYDSVHRGITAVSSRIS
jgi:hypothetical protein